MTKTIYISIGNSDDKLTQAEWSAYNLRVALHLADYATTVHGQWNSPSASPWQNACWCIEIPDDYTMAKLRHLLSIAAEEFRQDSIAWAEVSHTDFIGPIGDQEIPTC